MEIDIAMVSYEEKLGFNHSILNVNAFFHFIQGRVQDFGKGKPDFKEKRKVKGVKIILRPQGEGEGGMLKM